MAGSIHERDEQWNLLLSRAYGEVEANGGFRASLLEKLKTKQAEMRVAEESETVGEETAGILDNDEIWSRFLAKTYPSCEAGEQFRSNLLGRLKEKVQTGADLVEDPALQTILNKAYVPVEPRREFQTRLLVNLKERQKTTIMIKENYRKRSIFSSFASGLAAAAAVLFVVWL